jgi:NhaP-type Na+/H+ or K+/H+ antiporter
MDCERQVSRGDGWRDEQVHETEVDLSLAVFAFAIALLIAVLLSEASHRTALSSAVIFLVAGFLFGSGALNLIDLRASDETVIIFVEVALFSVLFADGMKIGVKELVAAWRLPGRALLLGLPLTMLFIAILGRFVLQLGWLEALLIGAVLSPTDPVFASALVSRPEVPARLRKLLNVESGLNDGIALPIVLAILALIGVEELEIGTWLTELAAGIAIGIAVPWLILKLHQWKHFAVVELYKPLLGFSIGLLVFSLVELLHANLFLAAFSAGVTIASVDSGSREGFLEYAEPVAELLKLGSILIFGALLSLSIFVAVEWWVYLYALLVLFLARPLALGLALIGSRLNWRERLATAWFGPRGFASVVYGLLVLGSQVYRAEELFEAIAIVIVGSMIAHSSTDVLVARWFQNVRTGRDQSTQQKVARAAERKIEP